MNRILLQHIFPQAKDTEKSFTKKFEPIHDYDESDMSELSTGDHSSTAIVSQSPKLLPNHLLLVSLLEHLCSIYESDTRRRRELFKVICDVLAKTNVMSTLSYTDELSSIRSQYRVSFANVIRAAQQSLKNPQLHAITDVGNDVVKTFLNSKLHGPSFIAEPDIHTSRYRDEFEELGKIGKGGFGSVYRVRNKLDCREYAVKKIKLKHGHSDAWMKMMREVRVLATLQHSNIVGYNAAWLEQETTTQQYPEVPALKLNSPLHALPAPVSQFYGNVSEMSQSHSIVFQSDSVLTNDIEGDKITTDTASAISSHECSVHTVHHADIKHTRSVQQQMVENFEEIHISSTNFKNERLKKKSNKNVDFNKNDSDLDKIRQNRREQREFRRSISHDPNMNIHHSDNPPHQFDEQQSVYRPTTLENRTSIVMYIQMQLCTRTLNDWLQERNNSVKTADRISMVNTNVNMKILHQIMKGLDYIHDQGLIHRDIKPKNIFLLDENLHVKIGDFGLTRDDTEKSPVPLTPVSGGSDTASYTSAIGTSIYAAPEQLCGNIYDCTSDVYSLGIVMFEMFHPFATMMERIECLKVLRDNNHIPERLYVHWNTQAISIGHMTSKEPSDRPSLKKLLHSELFLSKDQIIEDLRKVVEEKSKEIEKLKRLVRDKDTEINRIKLGTKV